MVSERYVTRSIKACTGGTRKCHDCDYEGCIHRHGDCRDDLLHDALELIESKPKAYTYTAHDVACILAELFGDDCACNFNGIDEWLPKHCELQDSCPNPYGVACWEMYLKYRDKRPKEETE